MFNWSEHTNIPYFSIVATQRDCIVLQFIYSQKNYTNKSIAHTKRLRRAGAGTLAGRAGA